MKTFCPDACGSTPASRARQHGFSLLEVMIAVVIVGVLTAVALPAYQSSIRKGRRAEAFTAISAVQQAQERFRSGNANYGSLAALPGISSSTPSGYYALTASGITATGYTVQAAAQGSQSADTDCAVVGVRLLNGSVSYGSGTSSLDWSDPGRCWAR